MFNHRYFATRYFADRYFAKHGSGATIALTVTSVHDYISDLHGRIDVLGLSVTGSSTAQTTFRDQSSSGSTVTLGLEVEA